MRIPFIIAMYTDRPLTDLQSRRRGRLIGKSKCYREYLKRLRRKADRRGDQRHPLPLKNGLFRLLYPACHPRFDKCNEGMADFERGTMDVPLEQWVLEHEVWKNAKGPLSS